MAGSRDPPTVARQDTLVVFVASALVAGLAIYIGAGLVVGRAEYRRAVLAALAGALVWANAARLLRGVDLPFVAPVLTAVAYLAVVRWRYRAGWLESAGIALFAWIAALVVPGLLAAVGLADTRAIGVPGA